MSCRQRAGRSSGESATHAVQRPGGLGHASGGDRRFAPLLARAAAAVGVDGVFMEVHPDPDNAMSDGPNMIPLAEIAGVVEQIEKVHRAVAPARASRPDGGTR